MSFFSKIARTFSRAASSVGQITASVTTSPVWKPLALAANAIPVPGLGTAISAGMLAAAKAGEAIKNKDSLVAAMASQLPGGDAVQAGFKVATGLAAQAGGMTGKDIAAVRAQIPDLTARAGFDAGLALHAGRATTPTAPAAIKNPKARAAYYATMGLHKTGAPKRIVKNTLAVAAHAPAAKAGAKLAVRQIAAKNETWLEWAVRKTKQVLKEVHV